MNCKYGKLFKNLSTNQVCCLQYDKNQNYYAFIKEMHDKGFNQCIVTSDIMIKIIQKFVLKGNIEIISIEFMVDDSELEAEISGILQAMKQNAGYWDVLKQKLKFLSQDDSIEMKKVSFRSLNGMGALFSIQVNGVMIISETEFENVSKSVSKIIEGCIK